MNFNQLCEKFGMIKQEKKLFYPRNFHLTENFIKHLKAEIKIQQKEGVNPREFASKLNRALQFFVREVESENR